MRKNEKISALYERLSRDDFGKDDDQQRESNSISNQKAMLEEFAARQGFTIFSLSEVQRAVRHMTITHISQANREKELRADGTISSERHAD